MEDYIRYINNIPVLDYEKFITEKVHERISGATDVKFDKWLAYPNEVLGMATIYGRPKGELTVVKLGHVHAHLKDYECEITIGKKCLYVKEWANWVYNEFKELEQCGRIPYNIKLFKHIPETPFSSAQYKEDYNAYHKFLMQEKISQAKKDCEDNLLV